MWRSQEIDAALHFLSRTMHSGCLWRLVQSNHQRFLCYEYSSWKRTATSTTGDSRKVAWWTACYILQEKTMCTVVGASRAWCPIIAASQRVLIMSVLIMNNGRQLLRFKLLSKRFAFHPRFSKNGVISNLRFPDSVFDFLLYFSLIINV